MNRILIFLGMGACVFALYLKINLERKGYLTRPTVPNFDPVEAKFHAHSLKRYSLGFDNLMAGLIWIHMLQKADDKPVQNNQVSWEYAQLDAVLSLDPHFLKGYEFGSVFLSVFRRDRLGAKMILEKWAERQPIYWRTHYLLGYHLFFEMGQYRQASYHILKAAELERAPTWLPALGVRLLSETGALVQSLKLSLELMDSYENPAVQERLIRRVRSLNYKIQENVWNEALKGYIKDLKKEPTQTQDLHLHLKNHFRDLASVVTGSSLSSQSKKLLHEKFAFKYDREQKKMIPVKSLKEMDLEPAGIFHPQTGEDNGN